MIASSPASAHEAGGVFEQTPSTQQSVGPGQSSGVAQARDAASAPESTAPSRPKSPPLSVEASTEPPTRPPHPAAQSSAQRHRDRGRLSGRVMGHDTVRRGALHVLSRWRLRENGGDDAPKTGSPFPRAHPIPVAVSRRRNLHFDVLVDHRPGRHRLPTTGTWRLSLHHERARVRRLVTDLPVDSSNDVGTTARVSVSRLALQGLHDLAEQGVARRIQDREMSPALAPKEKSAVGYLLWQVQRLERLLAAMATMNRRLERLPLHGISLSIWSFAPQEARRMAQEACRTDGPEAGAAVVVLA
jgi:hypothetical protein